MNNVQIEIFNAVVETHSFNKAAELLRIEYSKVKYQIDQLEKEFNSEFFLRSEKGCKLTATGEKFYAYSIRLAKEYYEMLSQFNQITSIIIGVDMSCPPDSLITATKEVCAIRKINVQVVDYDADYLMRALENGEIDCIYNYEFQVAKTISVDHVLDDYMVVVLSEKSPLSNKQQIEYADLLKTDIYFKHHDTRGSRKVADVLSSFSNEYRIHYGVSVEKVQTEMDKGKGVMVVPYNFWKHYMNGYECKPFRNKIEIGYYAYTYKKISEFQRIIKDIIDYFNNNYEP